MNKKVAAILLLVIGVALGYVILNAADIKMARDEMASQKHNETTTAQPTPSQETVEKTPGAYVTYSANSISEAKGERLLFFYAAWCPQCRALDADINAKSVPMGVTIIKVNYDAHQNLRQKYGVTLQTTIVHVDKNGELIKKYVAYDEPTLDAVIKNGL